MLVFAFDGCCTLCVSCQCMQCLYCWQTIHTDPGVMDVTKINMVIVSFVKKSSKIDIV